MSKHKGIKLRHKKGCAETPCTCSPSYRPTVYDRGNQRRIEGPTFRTLAEAKQWRTLKAADVERGKFILSSARTLREIAEEFLQGAEAARPNVLTRQGTIYKPSVLRDYRADLETRVLPDLGARKISDIRRGDVQRLVNRMLGEGLSGSRIRNILNGLRAVFRYAVSLDLIEDTPFKNLTLPSNRGKRERIADPVEARALLAALPKADRPLWATAMFAGLRAGELRALRWRDVDFVGDVIRVECGWDDVEGAIDPKSESARRAIPVFAELRRYLIEHQLRSEWSAVPSRLVFGRSSGAPFVPSTVGRRARQAWDAAGLRPVGLHEARHSFASLLIEAEVNPKKVSTWMGHSSITITFDRYGHLFPNANEEAVAKVDAYLARMTG